MERVQIELRQLLPDIPDTEDQCIDRLIQQFQGKEGLEKVHIADENDTAVLYLCFHYEPSLISVSHIQSLAKDLGSSITDKYGHCLIEVGGIYSSEQAEKIEESLNILDGVMQAAVFTSGMVNVEFETAKTDEPEILKCLRSQGLDIITIDVDVEYYIKKTTVSKQDKKTTKDKSHAEHGHEDHGHEDHGHSHGGIFGENTELIFSIICGVFLGVGFGLSFVATVPAWVSLVLYVSAYFFGGFFTAKEAVETVAKGGFEIDFLMLVAAIGAAILGAWAEGALLLFLFSLGHSLEHYAMGKAHKSIAALAKLAPKTALLKTDGKLKEVSIEDLKIGDVILVKPNSKISADGVVVSGTSSVNQASITGESVPVDKTPVKDSGKNWSQEKDIHKEHRVFSGTLNGNNTLEVKVIKEAKDSTLARLVKLVNEAQQQKSPTQRFTDKFEKYFVPAVLALVVLLNFSFLVIDETFSDSFYRAMAVLVAASPCALAISTPSAVLSGVARAAKGGVLIKGGRPLEDLGVLTTLAFDKTGTLTEGKPKLTEVVALADYSEEEILKIAIAVEGLSDHPLAKAIVRDGQERLAETDLPEAHELEAMLGKGIKANLGNETIYIGNLDLYETLDNNIPSKDIAGKVKALESNGKTAMLIRQNDKYIGIVALMDGPRKEAKSTLEQLKKIGIKHVTMLTGDNQNVADTIAKEIGLTDAWGSLLPEQKVEAIKKLKEKEAKVAMVGDGVNDAPAMANSTVGIAMGAAGSDVALETADIALMADNLDTLPFSIGLSRKAKNIIKQNLWISLGVVALLIPLTISGIATIGPAVLLHEGSTLVVVFNALRLLAYEN